MQDLRKTIRIWAKKIGKTEGVKRLVTQGVSPRAAEKLCDGTYPSEPKALREKLLRQLEQDGFSMKRDEVAS